MTTQRRIVRIGYLASAVVVMIGLLPAAAAPVKSARSPISNAARGDASAQLDASKVAAAGGKFNIPPRDPMSADGAGTYESPYGGAEVANSSASVARSKVIVTVPRQALLGYVQVCLAIQIASDFFVQTCCPGSEETCPDKGLVHREPTNYDSREPDNFTLNWTENRARLWVSSPSVKGKPFGVFLPAQANLLAFGSVPVSAKVNLTQPTDRDGYATPLRYRDVQLASTIPGTVVGGLSNDRSDGTSNLLFEAKTSITGPVNIRLSDVKIDGVAVDVGPNCRTSAPAQIVYNGPRGWIDSKLAPGELAGRPGEFQPLTPGAGPGSATGTISIPRFSGCRDGARSLDPLITAFASGPNNALRLSLSDAIRECSAGVDCPAYPPNSSDMPVPGQAAQALRKLPAHLLRALRVRVGKLPATVRRLVLKELPMLQNVKVR